MDPATAAKIAELEAEIAKLRLAGSSSSEKVKREQQRAAEGTKHTLESSGKIGGAFKMQADPEFLKSRAELCEKVAAKYRERVAAFPREPIKVTLPNGDVKEGVSWQTTPMDIAKAISNSLAKKVVVAEVSYTGERIGGAPKIIDAEADAYGDDHGDAPESGEAWDLMRPLEGDCKMRLCTFDDDLGKSAFFHSSAHVLGQSMERSFGVKLTIGPALVDGFYYDCFCGSETVSEDKWYPQLEATIKKISAEKQPFERLVVTKEEALELFDYNPFKVALIKSKIPDGVATTVYRNGPFVDLCMGPHIPNTSMIKAMKVFKHSATYWMADEDSDSLQRVYGVGFPDAKMLKKWEADFELRKQRDHRRIGPAQDLFFFHDLSPGSCFFLPNGAKVYNALVDFIKNEYWQRGYNEVVSPNIFSTDLWKISGHYQHYKDDMFLLTSEDKEFGMKPMNCPGHCLMFRNSLKSYRDLPIRMADFGVLHRNERSGALSGLTRVRRFQQDDAHIFCRPDQVTEEVVGALNFMKHVYSLFGMSFKLERSTRPKKAVGADTAEGLKRWNDAEDALGAALDQFAGKGNWRDNPGDGAFYGPKIDIKVFDCMDRKFQCATVQLDFNLPIRFDLKYRSAGAAAPSDKEANKKKEEVKDKAQDGAADEDEESKFVYKNLPNEKSEPEAGWERPVMVHRAMLGSVERMFAILTEHFGGKWPLWLSPRQVKVIPVHKDYEEYASKVKDQLRAANFNAAVDLTGNTLKKMIRNAQVEGYNFSLVVGKDDLAAGTCAIRRRDETAEQRNVPVPEMIAALVKERDDKVFVAAPAAEEASAKGGQAAGGKAAAPSKKGGKGGKPGAEAKSEGEGNAFTAIDIRVGQIVKAWEHPDSDKLWCEEIDVGEDQPRQIASGLRKYYSQEEMTGRRILVVCNLKPAKLGGFQSCGMVLCAKGADDKTEFIDVPAEAKIGERVFVEGCSGDPAGAGLVKKKKLWEALAKDLKTDGNKVATWNGKAVMTSAGACTAPTIADAPIA
mmetsp:Transcript_49327/g.96772  ORF Transcript_49327/g.96772 Transcript_49327/m.96772 type:complete len:1017 (+) Transcript_49327:38-3088(+)|eukprot:CAMPEP_0175137702 /NCGR_PEP_ID=MMETSP0087-20121206/9953_1 /TAXON_ID=136419 /ORGANISM="Unknown Unknown, Strain D1" /LENGTH=1016 /DNA_ID=CAMNT_0016420549 /DNA_START=34 /DNA_END=3084 /DNA_ORIENTATION=-